MEKINEELVSKKILKVHKVYNNINRKIVDFECLLCGSIHKKVWLSITKKNGIRVCTDCNLHKLGITKHNKIINLIIVEMKNQQNYISNRLMFFNMLKIRQIIEAFVSRDINLELLKNSNNTIGLKNPFVYTIWIDDLVVKTKKEDRIDRNRYFNNISKYENFSTGRSSFKKILKAQDLKFDDFEEVYANEDYECTDSKGYIVYLKKYYYFFKKGTIEEFYYKGE